jgi:phospholipase C
MGMAGMAGLAAPLLIGSEEQPKAREVLSDPTSSIRHIVVSCQEDHSVDHYYGRYADIENYGIPSGWMDHVKPYDFKTPHRPDLIHSWGATHTEWDHGKMDGFYKANGQNALGYYLREDLPGQGRCVNSLYMLCRHK